jgi:hypothetical protein
MGGFFRKSGNSRGVFPDTSIEEYRSLFTNEDERDSSCPCSIADGEINNQQPPTSCTPANPVIEEIVPEDF